MVNIIKTPDTYQCQICGETYEYLWQAEICEAQPLEKPKLEVGQIIRVKTQWQGIVKTRLVALQPLSNYSLILRRNLGRSLQDIKGVFKRLELEAKWHHEIAFKVEPPLQMGKDYEFTDVVCFEDVVGVCNGATL